MRVGKAVDPGSMLLEIWKSLDKEGLKWLMNLLNVILKIRKDVTRMEA